MNGEVKRLNRELDDKIEELDREGKEMTSLKYKVRDLEEDNHDLEKKVDEQYTEIHRLEESLFD